MRAGWRAGPSSQPPNPGLPGSFEDGDKDRLPADLVVRLLTLFASQLDKRLIGHRLHKPVAQKTQGQPGCADISLSGRRSWISVLGNAPLGQTARSFTRVRPVMISVPRAMGISAFSKRWCAPSWPTRNSATWLPPPDTGLW